MTGFTKLDTTIPITNNSVFAGTNNLNTWAVKANSFLASQVPSAIKPSQLLTAGMLLSPAVIAHYGINALSIDSLVQLWTK